MYERLAEHPAIFMSPIKEPAYFGGDLDRVLAAVLAPPRITAEADYLELFASAAGTPWQGEASPYYLLSETAAGEIAAFEQDARAIVSVREPGALIASLDHFIRYVASSRGEVEAHVVPRNSLYREIVRFGSQLKRYVNALGRSRVHVIVFDDLVKDPARVCQDVYRFLEIDDTFVPDSRPLNQSTSLRSAKLDRMMRHNFGRMRVARHLLPRRVRKQAWALGKHLNNRVVVPQGLSQKQLDSIRTDSAGEIALASDVIGRDLVSLWFGENAFLSGELNLARLK